MKIYISYFYQIRFFKKNMIPLSTAFSDPKWYHDFKNKFHKFIDSNGVLNGSRAEDLILPETKAIQLEESGRMCSKPCRFHPPDCAFMKAYKEHLDTIDFDEFISNCEKFCNKMSEKLDLKEEPNIILIVHEAPTVPCSERVVLKQWFEEHGIELQEWRREKDV